MNCNSTSSHILASSTNSMSYRLTLAKLSRSRNCSPPFCFIFRPSLECIVPTSQRCSIPSLIIILLITLTALCVVAHTAILNFLGIDFSSSTVTVDLPLPAGPDNVANLSASLLLSIIDNRLALASRCPLVKSNTIIIISSRYSFSN